MTMGLAAIRIVLVGTTHPGNIGASARAMKTMGLSQLVLVNPSHYPSADATARASGADDVLFHAQVVPDLETALQGCRLVIGTSARSRGISCPEISPRECATELMTASAISDVALVFGREHSGLTNDELDRCQRTVCIPANPDYSSLNLAAAVQILGYELRLAAGAATAVSSVAVTDTDALPATAEAMAGFYQHLETVLLQVGFLDPANPRHLMRRLRRLFNRIQPEQKEVHILRGILTSIQRVSSNRSGSE